MKRILFFLTLFVALTSFVPGDGWREILRKNNRFYWGGNWTLTGTKNQWGNGMSFSSKTQVQLDAFTNASDSNLLQLRRDDTSFAMRYSVTGAWRKFIMSNDTANMLSGYARTGNIISSITINTNNGITGGGTGSTFTLGLGNITPSSVSTSGAITGTTLGGTITTAAQPNITSIGTLTGLTVSGSVAFTGLTEVKKSKILYYDASTKVVSYGDSTVGGGGAVASVTGTANQITVSPTTGAVVVSLPTFINTDSSLMNYAYKLPTTSSDATDLNLAARIGYNSTNGTYITPKAGSIGDLTLYTAARQTRIQIRGDVNSTIALSGRLLSNNIYPSSTGSYDLGSATSVAGGLGALKFRKGFFTDTLSTEGVLGGTIYTAAQPNITSVGTLSSLSVSGNIIIDGKLLLKTTATAGISNGDIGLANSNVAGVIRFRNAADNAYINGLYADGSDNIQVGPSANGIKIASGSALVTFEGYGTGTAQLTSGVLSVSSDTRLKDIDKDRKLFATKMIMSIPQDAFAFWNYNAKSKMPLAAQKVKQFGLLADKVHAALGEEFAPTQPQSKEDSAANVKYYGLSDRALLSLSIQAQQEQQKKIESLEERIAILEKLIKK